MRFPRVRFTVRWMMAATLVMGLLLGALERRERLRFAAGLAAANADYQAAAALRMRAESALKQFTERYADDLNAAEDGIAVARTERRRIEAEYEWASVRSRKWSDAPIPFSLRLAFQRAKFAEELAVTRKIVLEKYVKARSTKLLAGEVAAYRVKEQAKKTEFDRIEAAGGSVIQRTFRRWKKVLL